MNLPEEYMSPWVTSIVSLLFGAGGVHWFKVYLENKRLSKKDFRDTLLARISDLEANQSRMQIRMGNLRVEMAHLETENKQLRRELDQQNEDHEQEYNDDQPA